MFFRWRSTLADDAGVPRYCRAITAKFGNNFAFSYHLMLLGRDFVVRLLKSGVKPTISGDLWSDSGMGLFGISTRYLGQPLRGVVT